MQESPPQPSDKAVFIEKSPAATVFVLQYGGWSTGSKVVKKAGELREALSNEGISVRSDVYYSAGYDPPFRIFHRHNEVLLLATFAMQESMEPSTSACAASVG